MKTYCSEEIRQVLSVVNYKVIMYTLLLQQSKGVVSLVKKIIRCVHALSAILHTETVLIIFISYHSLHFSLYGRLLNFNSLLIFILKL